MLIHININYRLQIHRKGTINIWNMQEIQQENANFFENYHQLWLIPVYQDIIEGALLINIYTILLKLISQFMNRRKMSIYVI